MDFIRVKKLSPTSKLPVRNLSTDAGLDLFAAEDVFIPVGKTAKIKTGIAIDVDRGFVGLIFDRSGMAVKGLRTGGGVIDTGYHGEVLVVIHNLNNESKLQTGYEVKTGDKIAQLLIQQISLPLVKEVECFEIESERGDRGFGSSGV